MKAVLLAAGLSSRLSGGVPKTLLFLHDQTTVIGHTISQLDSLGFSTTVVIGYKAPFFLSTLSTSVTFAYNPIYASTATLYSLKVAVDLLKEEGPLLVAYADQITSIKTLRKLVEIPDSVLVTALTPEYGAEYALQIQWDKDKIVGIVPFKRFRDWGPGYCAFGGFAFLSKNVLNQVEKLPPEVLARHDLPMILEGCRPLLGVGRLDCENINNPVNLIEVQRKLIGRK